jgi:hypothetical protein
MAKELKGLLARSGTHGRAQHSVDCSFEWNLDKCKQNLDKCAELDHDIDGSGDEEDKDDCSGRNQSRGSHIIDLDQPFLFIESNFCCRICASSGDSCVLDMSLLNLRLDSRAWRWLTAVLTRILPYSYCR